MSLDQIAAKMHKIAAGTEAAVPYPGQFDEFDREEFSFARKLDQGAHPMQQSQYKPSANATAAAKPGARRAAVGAVSPAARPAGSPPPVPVAHQRTIAQPVRTGTVVGTPPVPSVGQHLRTGWSAAGKEMAGSAPKFMARPGMALQALRAPGAHWANRLGRAARTILPHAGLLGAGLLGAKMLSGSPEPAYAKTGAALLLEKQAAVLSVQHREKLPTKDFAIPARKAKAMGTSHKIVGESKGRYPIHDLVHARAALSMVAKHGTEEEKRMVRAKVHAKYPQLGKQAAYDFENG